MIKKIKPSSPDIYLGKTIADNTLARIAHVNQLADQINNELAVIKPYKVYTALLTQSGVSVPLVATTGPLTVGVTYNIDVYIAGDDFSNVGGPGLGAMGQWEGMLFVATGTTPTNWTNLSNLLYDTGAPVVTVLENTIGNLWFTYVEPGVYNIKSDAKFLEIKTYVDGKGWVNGSDEDVRYSLVTSNESTVFIVNSVGLVLADGFLNNTPIEIRVYS